MNVTASTVSGGFYLARNYVSMSVVNAQADDGYYGVAGFGTRSSIRFFTTPDLASTRYTWRVSGSTSAPFGGETTSRLDFATNLIPGID